MKVLVVMRSQTGVPGGAGVSGGQIGMAQIAAALHARGADVELFVGGPPMPYLAGLDGVQTTHLRWPVGLDRLIRRAPARVQAAGTGVRRRRWLAALTSLPALRTADVVHVQGLEDAEALLPVAGGPLVVTHWGRVGRWRASGDPVRDRTLPDRLRRLTEGTRLVAIGDAQAESLAVAGMSVDAVIPPGIDLDHFSPGDHAAARRLAGLPEDDGLVLYVGRLARDKNVGTLLRSFALLRADRDDARLLVVGDGPLRPDLERLAAELGLGGSVTFRSFVPHQDLPAYYCGADVTVVPSDLLETFCMVALEAIACGCPVVVTDQVPEILARFPSVPGASPYDAAAMRDRIADALDGRLTAPEGGAVAEHGWAAVADRYLDVYRTAGRGGSRIPAVTRPPADSSARESLRHVRWIGGGSGSGKSTVARRVAERCGLRLYSTDEAMAAHAKRVRPEDAPLLSAFLAMDLDERWVDRSPEDMLATFHWFRGEGFALIVEDLLALAPEPVVVEGFRLLPELVEPLLADRDHAVWLLPTPEVRREVFEGRGGPSWAFLGRTGDPDRALLNLLERDGMFTERLAADVARLGLRGVEVDGTLGEDALVDRVAWAFGC